MTHRRTRVHARWRLACFTLLGCCAIALGASATAQAALLTGISPQAVTTGTAPFDGSMGPGLDPSATDDQVRSYDTVTYPWTINVNSSVGGTESYNQIDFTQTLPIGLEWVVGDVPLTCQGSGWSVTAQTLHCVSGPGVTGQAKNFTFVAIADGVADNTAEIADPASTSVTVTGATVATASTAAPTVFIRSNPTLDLYKQQPAASLAPGGYYLDYPVGVKVPDTPSHIGRRGSLMPDAPITFTDDFSNVSPNAVLDSCTPATVTCTPSGQSATVTFNTLPANPGTDRSIASATVRIFVPTGDVPGTLSTTNTVPAADLVAHSGATPIPDADLTDNTATFQLVTAGGTGNASFGKHFLDANGTRLPTQGATNDGKGQVRDTQIVQSELDLSNTSNVAPVPTPAVCDVWDNTRAHLSTAGPGPAAHAGSPVWESAGGLTQGTDYVVEYSTQATATGTDAQRWTELQNRTDCEDPSDTSWTATLPADPSTVTKVRVMLTGDLPAAAPGVAFRVNLAVADATDGDYVANFLGARVGTTWTKSTYSTTTNSNHSGDRVRINGVTVQLVKNTLSPNVPNGTKASILSGQPVQFQLKPTVTSLDIGSGAPVATNVVIRDRLPLGLTFDPTQPTTPGSITPVLTTDGTGRQILTWTIPSMTKGSEPVLTFWANSATTAIGDRANEAIVDSTEDIGGLDTFPPSPLADQHDTTMTTTLSSSAGVGISKLALQSVVEPLDPLAFQIEYANLTSADVAPARIIDVLPFATDGTSAAGGNVPGRSPATADHGTLPIASIDVTSGETILYTDADPAAVYAATDPSSTTDADFQALPPGKSWCPASDFGMAGCPADMAAVTAFQLVRALLPAATVTDVVLHLAPTGNRSGDIYANTAAMRYNAGNLGALSNVVNSRVVASTIGDYVWEDLNRNGIQDADEPPLANVAITLTGTDKHGRSISVDTKTNANGKYLFTSSSQAGQDAGVKDLVSGSYTVTFHRDGLPAGTTFTTQHTGTVANDSDPDADGVATVTMPDPSPTGMDGQNLTIDAGVVRGVPGTPAKKAPVDTSTTPAPPTDTPAPKPTPPTTTKPAPPVKRAHPTLSVHAAHAKVKAGKTVTYTITVRNTGQAAARNVMVCDTPGSGLVVSRMPKGARFSHGKLCWRLGTLRAGAKRVLSVTMRAAANSRGGSVNNAVVLTATGLHAQGAASHVRVTRASAPSKHVGVTG